LHTLLFTNEIVYSLAFSPKKPLACAGDRYVDGKVITLNLYDLDSGQEADVTMCRKEIAYILVSLIWRSHLMGVDGSCSLSKVGRSRILYVSSWIRRPGDCKAPT
jgi:hypothetical protein